MNALLTILVIGSTAIAGVTLGIFSAYYALAGLLAACNPARTASRPRSVLVPQPSSASGD